MDTPLNKYTAYTGTYNGDTNISFIEDNLCEIAQMDAWHDHHTITGLSSPNIESLVRGYAHRQCNKPRGDEDAFMFSKLIAPGQNTKYCRVSSISDLKSDPNLQNISPGIYEFKPGLEEVNFNPIVSTRYKVIYCNTETDIRGSLIQNALKSQGIDDDYFLIKDTAKSDYSKDLKKTQTGQIATTLLTGPGIYDPGPTTTPFTQTGVEQGFTDPNSNSKFGIIDFSKENDTVVSYPEWKSDTYTKYGPIERMIYSKYSCVMIANTNNTVNNAKEYITQTNSTLYIRDGNKVFYVNKTNSDKATDLTELAFSEKLEKIGAHRFPAGTQFPFPDATHIITKGGYYKIFSKKVGDSGQALYTLRDKIFYKEYDPTTKRLESKKSNGIHGFVSFDRVAIVASIFYGTPFAVYITDNGFVMYISNQLIESVSSPVSKYNRLVYENRMKIRKITDSNQTSLIRIVAEQFEKYNRYFSILADFVNSVSRNFIANISGVDKRARDNVKAIKYDKEYKLWISKLYLYNQLAYAIGNFLKKRHTVDAVNDKLTSAYVKFEKDISKRPEFEEVIRDPPKPYSSDVDITVQKRLNNSLTNILSSITECQSILEELKAIDAVYEATIMEYDFTRINGLVASSQDEKSLNTVLKKKNAQIADSISNANIAQGLHNPGCLTALFNCFGSNKFPHFGPFDEILKFYQNLNFSIIIRSYHEFLQNVKEISREGLFRMQFDYLNNRLEEGENELNDDVKRSLKHIYQQFIGIRGGSIIKGGLGDNFKTYLEYNSFVSIIHLYKLEVRKKVKIALFERLIERCPKEDCNTIINNKILEIFKMGKVFENIREKIFNASHIPNDANTGVVSYRENEIDISEITNFNLFTRNIFGENNQKLFRYMIMKMALDDIINGYDEEYINEVRKLGKKLKNIPIDFEKGAQSLEWFTEVILKEIQDMYPMENPAEQFAIDWGKMNSISKMGDINEIFIDYLNMELGESTRMLTIFSKPQISKTKPIRSSKKYKKNSKSKKSKKHSKKWITKNITRRKEVDDITWG